MTALHVEHLLLAPLLLNLLVIALLSLVYSLRHAIRHGKILADHNIYQCATCRRIYLYRRGRPMEPCPRCGDLNELIKR